MRISDWSSDVCSSDLSGMRMNTQTQLSAEQIAAFYHDEFVEDQVRDFRALIDGDRADKVIVDIGGGCGFFERRLRDVAGERTRVVDMDSRSIEECARLGVEGQIGDALHPVPVGAEHVVTFNLILHHLVGPSEAETRELQESEEHTSELQSL